jgi:hypothetical protein
MYAPRKCRLRESISAANRRQPSLGIRNSVHRMVQHQSPFPPVLFLVLPFFVLRNIPIERVYTQKMAILVLHCV